MITAVDSNVLLDVLGADPRFGPRSREALRTCLVDGSLIACEIVWAEVSAGFPGAPQFEQAMSTLGVRFDPIRNAAALEAGSVWRSYRRKGSDRVRLIADFMVGAHAQLQADRLLTRDRGFYRAYFRRLDVLDPST